MLKFYNRQVVFQEVPNEISVSFSLAGCKQNCPGCSWKEAVKHLSEQNLTDDYYYKTLDKYKNLASCILFFGGEWNQSELAKRLKEAKNAGYKTCLYTGVEKPQLQNEVIQELDYLKTGRYVEKLGALNSPYTNQKFINVKTGESLNHYFRQKD